MNAPTRAEFLAERKKGLGGTDLSVIIGLSPYKTPLELWLEKTGRAEQQPAPDAEERMYWGTVLEDVVARRYADLTGRKLQRVNEPLVHPAGVVRGNIDRAIVNPEIAGTVRFKDGRLTTDRILEVKTAHAMAANSADWGTPGSDEIPQHYWIQVQTYLGLAQVDVADLAVLFGGQKLATYTIQADRGVFADLVDAANTWWEKHIVGDLPPDPSTEDDARRLWKSHIAGKELIVDATVADAIEELARIKEQIGSEKQEGSLEHRAKQLRDIILPAFGDAESISYMGRKLATWKANKASSKTDWKAALINASADARICAHPEVVQALKEHEQLHTTTTDGARVLRLNTKEL